MPTTATTPARIRTAAERAPLYAAYRAADDEAERLGQPRPDMRIVHAAVEAYDAARRDGAVQ